MQIPHVAKNSNEKKGKEKKENITLKRADC